MATYSLSVTGIPANLHNFTTNTLAVDDATGGTLGTQLQAARTGALVLSKGLDGATTNNRVLDADRITAMAGPLAMVPGYGGNGAGVNGLVYRKISG
jgi:hypothetical protein